MTCQIIPSPEVDKQIVMALSMLKAFIPRSLRELRVGILEQAEGEPAWLAEWSQQSGYREGHLLVAPALSDESAESILQVLRHELVHAHLHQLDIFVEALIASCPGNRSRAATTKVYHMLRESVADDISYGLGDVLVEERGRQEMDRLMDMADQIIKAKAKEQAIW